MTSHSLYCVIADLTFQLTSSQGGWPVLLIYLLLLQIFNSHPHKEDDSCTGHPVILQILFNSHPHKEDDFPWRPVHSFSHFSTHILTRRMTRRQNKQYREFCFSTHILTRRMTSNIVSIHAVIFVFNSHPHKEDDIFSFSYNAPISSFQLTSSQGGWLLIFPPYFRQKFFNSHPHKEDDEILFKIRISIDFSTHILTRRMTGTSLIFM